MAAEILEGILHSTGKSQGVQQRDTKSIISPNHETLSPTQRSTGQTQNEPNASKRHVQYDLTVGHRVSSSIETVVVSFSFPGIIASQPCKVAQVAVHRLHSLHTIAEVSMSISFSRT